MNSTLEGLLETHPGFTFYVQKENRPLVEGYQKTQSLDQLSQSYQCRAKQKIGLEREKHQTASVSSSTFFLKISFWNDLVCTIRHVKLQTWSFRFPIGDSPKSKNDRSLILLYYLDTNDSKQCREQNYSGKSFYFLDVKAFTFLRLFSQFCQITIKSMLFILYLAPSIFH